jgi:DNA-binding XRE family transcriptional regulator
VTPAQCRAARGIAFLTQVQLAETAEVPRNVIIDFELNSLPPKPAYLEAIRRVLQERNVEFIDGEPPSVRLRF